MLCECVKRNEFISYEELRYTKMIYYYYIQSDQLGCLHVRQHDVVRNIGYERFTHTLMMTSVEERLKRQKLHTPLVSRTCKFTTVTREFKHNKLRSFRSGNRALPGYRNARF